MIKGVEKINLAGEDAQAKTDEHSSEDAHPFILEAPIEQISEEYIKYHPEIYKPDQAEIRSFSKDIAGKVSEKDMLDFVKMTIEADMDDAEHFLVSRIANAYGLKNMPCIVHLDADDVDPENSDKGGGFDKHNNIITLYFGEKCIDSFYDHVEMLSHELWHARQYEMIRDGEERGKLYEKNFNCYIKSKVDKDGYEQQIVEAEAYDIGIRLAMKYMGAQYSCLDANDLKELRVLKTKHDIYDISGLDKAFSNGEINKDDYWLLYFDFIIYSSAA